MSSVGSFTWEHQDPLGLALESEKALLRADARAWPAKGTEAMPDAVRELRALILRSLSACWQLTREPPSQGPKVVFPDFSTVPFRSQQHRAIAALLLNTWILLSETKGTFPPGWPPMIRTTGAEQTEPVVVEEAGNPWLVGIAIVVGAAAWCVGVTVVAQKASEVIDRKLAREEDSARMTQQAADAIRLIESHAAAELQAGKSKAYSEGERMVLGKLLDTQKELALKQGAPLPSPLPTSADIGTGFKIGATGFAVALVVLAYFVAK